MIIYLITTKNYKDNSWIENRISCYKKEIARKRMTVRVIFSKDELLKYKNEYEKNEACIILALINIKNPNEIYKEYEEFPMPKVIDFHHNHDIFSNEFSYIATDVFDSMRQVLDVLKKHNCKQPALFAMSSLTGRDPYRISAYKKLNYGYKELIFYDNGHNYLKAVKELLNCNTRIDALICSNDLHAIRLIKVLKAIDEKWANKVLIISFFDAKLASLITPSLSTTSSGFEQGAKEAIKICEELWKNKNVSAIHKFIQTDLIERESSMIYNPEGINFDICKKPTDKKIKEIVEYAYISNKIEKLLLNCDDLDIKIIYYLMIGYKIKDIQRLTYCSLSTINYRIKKYINTLECNNHKEAIDILNDFIDINKLRDKNNLK